MRYVFCRHGARNTVALDDLAAELKQAFTLFHCFHPLGDKLQLEHLRQLDDAFQEGKVVGVFEHIANEAAVDFDDLHRNALEV